MIYAYEPSEDEDKELRCGFHKKNSDIARKSTATKALVI